MTHAMRFKSHASKVEGRQFVLSDESVDRMGDIIRADGWDLANFKKNPIALFGHSSGFPIGKWANVRVENKQLRGHLEMAPEGSSPRIDEIRRLIDAGILCTVSVGFAPVESERRMEGDKYLGEIFTKQELLESSVVSVPANPNAIALARSLNVSPATLDIVFGEHADKQDDIKLREVTGESADHRRSGNGKGSAMSQLAQRITNAQAEIVRLVDEIDGHMKTYNDDTVTAADLDKTEMLNGKLKLRRRNLESLQETERNEAGIAAAGTAGEGDQQQSRELTIVPRGAVQQRGERHTDVDDEEYARRLSFFSPMGTPLKDLKPLDFLVRQAVCTLFSKQSGRTVDEVCRGYEPYNNEKTRAAVTWSTRAATNPALTTVAGWAAELVQQIYADLQRLLMPSSVFPRLAGMGTSLTFGRAGKIIVPLRAATPTIAGSFVGEGLPIPVRMGALTSFSMVPKKLAVISTWSREMNEHSIPAIEGLIREFIADDTSVAIDSILLDANPATAIRPAGLFNGVTPITATAITGGAFAAFVTDIKLLSDALTVSTKGNLRKPVWLMNPSQVLSASMVVPANTGVMPFRDELSRGTLFNWPVIDSGTVPLKSVGLVDAADFVTAGGDAPRFDISDSATLHEEDTAPLAIGTVGSPATIAAPVRSLFQTDTLALRMIQQLNWLMRRTGTVALIQNVTW